MTSQTTRPKPQTPGGMPPTDPAGHRVAPPAAAAVSSAATPGSPVASAASAAAGRAGQDLAPAPCEPSPASTADAAARAALRPHEATRSRDEARPASSECAWTFSDLAAATRALADFLDPDCPAREFIFRPRETGGPGTYHHCLCWHRYATPVGAALASLQYLILQASFAQPVSAIKCLALRRFGARIHRTAYLSPQVFVDPLFPSLLTVERDALLGVGVRIALHDQLADRFRAGRVIVRAGATIGADARIACGVEIGAGARVALGAVVLRDVPAGAFVVGNPARIVPERR